MIKHNLYIISQNHTLQRSFFNYLIYNNRIIKVLFYYIIIFHFITEVKYIIKFYHVIIEIISYFFFMGLNKLFL